MDEAARDWDLYCARQEEEEQARMNEMVETYCLSLPLTCGQCWNYCDYKHQSLAGRVYDGVCVTIKEDMPVHIEAVDKDSAACEYFEAEDRC